MLLTGFGVDLAVVTGLASEAVRDSGDAHPVGIAVALLDRGLFALGHLDLIDALPERHHEPVGVRVDGEETGEIGMGDVPKPDEVGLRRRNRDRGSCVTGEGLEVTEVPLDRDRNRGVLGVAPVHVGHVRPREHEALPFGIGAGVAAAGGPVRRSELGVVAGVGIASRAQEHHEEEGNQNEERADHGSLQREVPRAGWSLGATQEQDHP